MRRSTSFEVDDPPLVTVITATRNRPEFLLRALESVRSQSYGNYEAIVIDDGSRQDVIERYGEMWTLLDDRFKLLLPTSPDGPGTGPGATRNRGIRAARGEYLAFLDDDDQWIRSDHLGCGIEAMRRFDADFYITDLLAERGGRLAPDGHLPLSDALGLAKGMGGASPGYFRLSVKDIRNLLSRFMVHPDAYIVRRDLLERAGPFLERIWFGEDYNLLIRIADHAETVLYRSEYCVRYRLPEGDSVSLVDGETFEKLQTIFAAQHGRLACRRSHVRRAARAKESWTLRELAGQAARRGSGTEAIKFAWQGASVHTTPGSVWFLLKALGNAAGRALAGAHN